jgi:hypothetical protein
LIEAPLHSRAAISAPSSPGCSSSLLRDPLARRGRQREVRRVAPERRGVERPQLIIELRATFEVRLRATQLRLSLELLCGCPHRARGQRPIGAGVQIRQPLKDGKLGT